MGWGWIDRSARCWGIAGSKILVDLVSDCLQLTLLELADLEPAPALGRTDECAYISFKTARHAGSPWCAAVPRRTAARADWWCGSPGVRATTQRLLAGYGSFSRNLSRCE